MFKITDNKTGITESSINSNNKDVGDNKNNKTKIKGNSNKQVNSKNEVNINFDPNKITQNLILELGNKQAALDKQLYKVRSECDDCFENSRIVYDGLMKKVREIQSQYSFEDQFWNKTNSFIHEADSLNDASSTLNELKQKAYAAAKMIGVPFCDKHTQLGIELQNLQIEIEALEKSIKLISRLNKD